MCMHLCEIYAWLVRSGEVFDAATAAQSTNKHNDDDVNVWWLRRQRQRR